MATPKHRPRPDYVHVLNHTYSIEWMLAEEWQRRDFDQGSDGLTYNDRGLILMRLVPDRRESLYQEVLLHEVTHAVWDSTGMSLDGGTQWSDLNPHEAEEAIILRQSPLLLWVLRMNPILADWLLHADPNEVR